VIRISLPEQAAPTISRFEKHSVATRVGRTIGNAMLNDMNVHTGSNRPSDAFPRRSVNDLFHFKIGLCWLLPMEQSSGYPNLVSHLDTGFGRYSHGRNLVVRSEY
jgi:hypothetical protein